MGAPQRFYSTIVDGMKANDYAGNPAGFVPAPGLTWGGKGNLPVPLTPPAGAPAALTQTALTSKATAGTAGPAGTVLSGPLAPAAANPAAGAGAAGQMYGGKTLTGS